jgi:hypothetical protein
MQQDRVPLENLPAFCQDKLNEMRKNMANR